MKKTMLLAALFMLPLCAAAPERTERLDSVVISASRAGEKTPVTYTSVGRKALQAADPSASLPMVLELTPSVVTWNEGGTGLGNSSMTIRGSKGSQINVTLNGITLNDAESQEVFWVNIPALTGLLASVQVQRGLGTSANGAGAFGASVNMSTALVQPDPSFRAQFSAGSFGTRMASVAGSTGRLPGGWYMHMAWSTGHTDGYIRNALVDASSAYAVLGWMSGKRSVRLTWLMGSQRSGITWDGISLAQYAKDRRYNGAGKYLDDEGNVQYYPNQTDNYRQHHLQLNYTRAFGAQLSWSNTLDYTRGDGYDESYKVDKDLADYGYAGTLPAASSDMIYRKRMDNDLWCLNSSLRYRSAPLDVTAGVYLSHYRGGHWGEMLWVKALEGAPAGSCSWNGWYDNRGRKLDGSAFIRAEWRPTAWLTAYADLQYRAIRYHLTGSDDDWRSYGANPADLLDYARVWRFFNPRLGATAVWGPHKAYLSAAIGQREPGRGDIKENVKGVVNPIVPEKMLDVELGYGLTLERFTASANLYLMEYKDMLLETGLLSSSGYAIKENVPRAWRRGVELALAWQPLRWLRLDGNATLSMNQIADYTAYVPYSDNSGKQLAVHYGRVTMLMSPSAVGMARLQFFPWKGGDVAFSAKYVGKQYIDNSMREDLVVPAYWTAALQVSHAFPFGLTLALHVNNLLNRLYYASGWRWQSYNAAADRIDPSLYVYPQAPLNALLSASFSF